MEKELAKYFSGEASESEKKKVRQWRAESPENAAEFLDYKQAWLLGSPVGQASQDTLDRILTQPKAGRAVSLFTYLKYAAAVLILLSGAFLVYRITSDLDKTVIAQEGEYILPDGSRAFLHKNATLDVRFSGKERLVRVEGKVHFEVKRDESLPFIAATESSEVKVLGTSFVVDAENSRVFVESGLVRFSSKEIGESVELSKGQMAQVTEQNKVIAGAINDLNYLAWKDKKISFRSMPLQEVAAVLKDVYDLNVEFASPGIKNCLLSADFNNKTSEEVAGFIARAFGYEYEISEDNTLTLSGQSCE